MPTTPTQISNEGAQRYPLTSTKFEVTVNLSENDFAIGALLLQKNDTVPTDKDFIYFNEHGAVNGPLQYEVTDGREVIAVDLARVPADISTVRFVADRSIFVEGARMSDLSNKIISIQGDEAFERNIDPIFDASNNAGVVFEFRRDKNASAGWRVDNFSGGWNGGLAEVLTQHGVSVDSPEQEAPAPTPAPAPALNLSKSRQRVDVFKNAVASAGSDSSMTKTVAAADATVKALEEIGLANEEFEVFVLLDVSYSIDGMLRVGGAIDDALQVMSGVGIAVDDNGRIPVLTFSARADLLNQELTAYNRNDIINAARRNLDGYTYYAPGVELARREIIGGPGRTHKARIGIFITDGGDNDQPGRAEDAFRSTTDEPVFWIAGAVSEGYARSEKDFPQLQALDKGKRGRRDNFSLEIINDIKNMAPEALVRKIFGGKEFQKWFTSVRKDGILLPPPGLANSRSTVVNVEDGAIPGPAVGGSLSL